MECFSGEILYMHQYKLIAVKLKKSTEINMYTYQHCKQD